MFIFRLINICEYCLNTFIQYTIVYILCNIDTYLNIILLRRFNIYHDN